MTQFQMPPISLKKAMNSICLGFILPILFSAPLMAKDTTDITKKIDQLFATWDHNNTPGAAVIVTQKGKIIHRKGYGLAHMEYAIPITPETIFHAASVSKQFTAFAIAMLEDQGKVDVKKPVQNYMPEVPIFDQPITVKQMIHHTSGLRDQWALLGLQGHTLSDVITDASIMHLVTMQQDLNFEPNSRFMYSNTGYTILAQIVGKVNDTSFRKWANDEIFKPLGMNDTHFHDDYTEIVPNRAYSYQPNKTEGKTDYSIIPLSYGTVGATGLLTTVDDLSKWMDNLMSGAIGGKALRDRIIISGKLNDGTDTHYAYGLNVTPYKGIPAISHSGGDAGFRSHVMVLPEQGIGIAVLSNTADFPSQTISQQIADLFLPKHSAKIDAANKKKVANIDITPSHYTSRYMMEDSSFLHITEREDGINLQVGPTALKLYPTAKDSFFITEAEAGVSFDNLEDGIYKQASMHKGNRKISGVRVAVTKPDPKILAGYAGKYFIPEVDSFISIDVGGTELILSKSGVATLSISYTKNDVFISPLAGVTLAFNRNSAGEISSARVSMGRIQNLLIERIIP